MPYKSQVFAKWKNTQPSECFILHFLETFHQRSKMKPSPREPGVTCFPPSSRHSAAFPGYLVGRAPGPACTGQTLRPCVALVPFSREYPWHTWEASSTLLSSARSRALWGPHGAQRGFREEPGLLLLPLGPKGGGWLGV